MIDVGEPALEGDLHTLLGRAVDQLAASTSCTQVVAWGAETGGEPRLLAARIEGASLVTPAQSPFAAARALPRAFDLGGPGVSTELKPLLEQGFSAAAPIFGNEADGTAAGVILLGGPGEPAGRVRPRTLAALSAAAERLRGPLLTAAAAKRLSSLDHEVQQLNRLAALGGLVSEIAHEIRNPLVSIKTFLQLFPERESDPEFTENFLGVARDELQRIERLLTVVLQHGRTPREEDRGDLGIALETVLALVRFRADDREISVVAELPDAIPAVGLGGDELRQVLLNLALNAIEAAPERGNVQIRGKILRSRLQLDIEDDGSGIPDDVRPHLFTPFFSTRTERPGGLGLAITARIVERAGGRIDATNRPSGGARLRLSLPLA
ncbi:MAG: hypothetical protein GY723_03685 [bacterium]|nr:hypothetical protein [bacterium]MCP5071446.1 hypothetical protein [bacterium]